MHVTVYAGIVFIEGDYPNAKKLGDVKVSIGGVVKSAQLSNLDEVKAQMARKATELGANAIIKFEYGQKSVGMWRSVISRDDVNWYGKGVAGVISSEKYTELVEQQL